jgi:hypothetical protein
VGKWEVGKCNQDGELGKSKYTRTVVNKDLCTTSQLGMGVSTGDTYNPLFIYQKYVSNIYCPSKDPIEVLSDLAKNKATDILSKIITKYNSLNPNVSSPVNTAKQVLNTVINAAAKEITQTVLSRWVDMYKKGEITITITNSKSDELYKTIKGNLNTKFDTIFSGLSDSITNAQIVNWLINQKDNILTNVYNSVSTSIKGSG